MHLVMGKCEVLCNITQESKDVKQTLYPVVSLLGPFCSFPACACREQLGYIKTNSSSFYLHVMMKF